MSVSSPFQLLKESAGLLVVDIQERLSSVMPDEELEWTVKHVRMLIEGAKILGLPIWVAEQYPKGMGRTLPEVMEVLPDGWTPLEKIHFSCVAADNVFAEVEKSKRKQVILCGMEAHICVFQTARDFVKAGYQVFVPMDAVISRTEENASVGLNLIEQVGGVLTSTEVVLFDLLQKAGTPEFKKISALVK